MKRQTTLNIWKYIRPTPIMVFPLRPEEIPKDLICSICLSVPLKPAVVTNCSHVFCEECITETLYHQECHGQDGTCPVCRCDISTHNLLPLQEVSPLAYRIWSDISVKCEHYEDGCNWKGSILDYRSHKSVCKHCQDPPKQSNDEGKEIIHDLRKENEMLKTKNKILTVVNEKLEEKCRNQNWKAVTRELDRLRSMVENSIERPTINSRGGYKYDRFSVPQLSKLICQNLENMPRDINPDKIFECVMKIGFDLQQDREDEPEHFYVDCRMLMGVCLASTWFTVKQLDRIRDISYDNGWA